MFDDWEKMVKIREIEVSVGRRKEKVRYRALAVKHSEGIDAYIEIKAGSGIYFTANGISECNDIVQMFRDMLYYVFDEYVDFNIDDVKYDIINIISHES